MPDFLIIGAQKCGTTSLYHYLIQHPQIRPAAQKELHFFDLFFSKGVEWYLEQFPRRTAGAGWLTGESSPYYIFHPLVPQRVWRLFPEVKLIVLLREPVARAWSHYHHEVRLGYEKLSFEDAIALEPERLKGETEKILADETYYSFNHQHCTYLSRGAYAEQLLSWMELFPKKQFLILKSEDFYANPAESVKQVFEFLGLPDCRLPEYGKYNAGEYPPISDATQRYLREYFQPHNQRLEKNFGITLSHP
ncbi:sulfotransferase domain-containing protein [Kamptonema formosum]|uniref:sulfotransferase domain-containing protein n=1 Tax=Kamptonema formosum TaxID=331992 RepID=UPI00034929FD|nr:sulfotransferase domain-containing protein [Oscillatoria sp. PCC 10802]